MTKLEELRAAYEAATPGKVVARRALYDDEPGGYLESDLDFLGNNNEEAAERIEGALAQFLTLAHNLMPQLLEAVELIQEACEHDTPISFVRKVEAILEKLK